MKTPDILLPHDKGFSKFPKNKLDKPFMYIGSIPHKIGPWLYETRKTPNIFLSHDQGSSEFQKNELDKFVK